MNSSCSQVPSWYVLESNIFGIYSPQTKWCNLLLLILWFLFLAIIIWSLVGAWRNVIEYQQCLDEEDDQSYYNPIF